MKSLFLSIAVLTALVFSTPAARAQPNSPDGLTYKSGYSSMMKLGTDLYKALTPKQQAFVSPQPISIETEVSPFVRMLYYADEPKPIRGVWISVGFIDLVNHVAHAKAIDTKKKGYFKDYIQILAHESGEKELQPLPHNTDPAFWTEEMLNEQLSNFNSIVGMVVGIKLAHHYLGHYEKYKDKLADAQGNAVPISNLLTPKEWDDALESGVKNALNAGCTIEGVLPFYEVFDKMAKRPAWTAEFVPDNVKFAKTKKDLERLQKKFFTDP